MIGIRLKSGTDPQAVATELKRQYPYLSEPNGRRLSWHSIPHSTGMYVYDQERAFGMVAEVLRHKSLESARKYAHPTPESKTDVLEAI